MAWNTPGSDNGDDDRPSRNRRPVAPGDLVGYARRLFGDGGSLLRWSPLLIGVWLVVSGVVVVPDSQRAVVLRFGQFARLLAPGPHVKLPWPFERAYKVDTTTLRSYSETVPVLTADGNRVNVDLNVQYRVADAQQFLFGSQDAETFLRRTAVATVREAAGQARVDALGATGQPVASAASTLLSRAMREDRTGLEVTALTLQNVRPPDEVRDAFDDVGRAEQEKARAVAEAQAYAAAVIPKARGEAAAILAEAEGDKASSIARATGDAQRFSLLVEQYKAAPDVTRKRLWLETVQQVLSRNRTIVGGDSRVVIELPPAAPTPAPTRAATGLAPSTTAPSTPAAATPLPTVTATAPVPSTGERGPRAPRAPRSGDDR